MDCGAYFIIQIIIILREQELCLLIKYERQPNVALQGKIMCVRYHMIFVIHKLNFSMFQFGTYNKKVSINGIYLLSPSLFCFPLIYAPPYFLHSDVLPRNCIRPHFNESSTRLETTL